MLLRGMLTPNDLGNRRDAGPIGGASVLTDGLAGNMFGTDPLLNEAIDRLIARGSER